MATVCRSHGRGACRATIGRVTQAERKGRAMEPGAAVHDFDFYMGTWWIHNRRLTKRLAGSDEWEEFEGTSHAWPILGGAGNIDDNVVDLPNGQYRAISLRTYDLVADQWSIWWLDGRSPGRLDPPVVGS